MQDKKPPKLSVGVALCRIDPETKLPQILLVKSRVTYNYNAFIFGRYALGDWTTIQRRLNNMTTDEKIHIASLNFDAMWQHSWLRIPQPNIEADLYKFYMNSKTKFERLISRDAGRRLIQCINYSTNVETGWEIPKGRFEHTDQNELDCAARELMEETGIHHNDFKILENIQPIVSEHRDERIVYKCKYYIGHCSDLTTQNPHLHINYTNIKQVAEIADIRWFALRDLSKIPHQHCNLHTHSSLALKLFKSRVIRV